MISLRLFMRYAWGGIYANLRKALSYVVAVHLPIAGMTLLPLLFGSPLVFAPIHIVF